MNSRTACGFVAVILLGSVNQGCVGKIQPAMGSGSVVALVSSSSTRGAAEVLTRALEAERYVLPRPEKPFQVTPIRIGTLDEHRYDKNVVILCNASEGGQVLKTVREIVDRETRLRLERGQAVTAFLVDTWARYQNVVILAAPSAEALVATVEAEGPAIAARLEADVIRAIGEMFSRQIKVPGFRTGEIRRHGWGLRIPKGYVLKREEPEVPLAVFQQENPPRVISVTWRAGAVEPSAAECVEWRSELAWSRFDEDEVVEDTVRWRDARLCDAPAVRIEGLWKNVKYVIGGPFITYLLPARECDRTFLIDLTLYAPGMEQVAFLREMEAIARSFVCCLE